MSESRDKHRSPSGQSHQQQPHGEDEDFDTYELDLDDVDEPSPPRTQSTKRGQPAASASRDQTIEDTYELDVPDQPPETSPRRTGRPVKEGEGKAAGSIPARSSAEPLEQAPSPTSRAADARAEAPPASPGSSIISGDEPKFVDASVAAGRREEARVRRAQEEAEKDAKRRKRNLMYIGIILVTVIFLIVWFNM